MMIRPVLFIMGVLLLSISACLFLPLGVSLYYADGAAFGIGGALFSGLVLGVFFVLFKPKGKTSLGSREGLAVVGLCWLAAALLGSLPYIFTGQLLPVDAIFESASGFTTTGATVITDLETTPKGLLMWRSLTHWLGGMGIIVFSLAILPALGVGGMQLYKAEAPGPRPDKLTPRIQDTAKLLWAVYGLMTVLEIVLLLLAGMDLFDAVNHTFATVATGGFSTKNASIAAFPSPTIQWIIIAFMFMAGINFTLHYRMLKGKVGGYFYTEESRLYIQIVAISVLFTMVVLVAEGKYTLSGLRDVETVLRAATFQIVSIITTTGFVTENYVLWPPAIWVIIVLCSFIGGCAGSTGGGFKIIRVLTLGRVLRYELFRMVHPHSVRRIKIEGRALTPMAIMGVLAFLLIFLLLLCLGTVFLSLFELDIVTSFSAVLACLSNVGPGLGMVGPVDTFYPLPTMVKVVLTFMMLLGRLEIYALLIVLLPEFWRK